MEWQKPASKNWYFIQPWKVHKHYFSCVVKAAGKKLTKKRVAEEKARYLKLVGSLAGVRDFAALALTKKRKE